MRNYSIQERLEGEICKYTIRAWEIRISLVEIFATVILVKKMLIVLSWVPTAILAFLTFSPDTPRMALVVAAMDEIL